MENKEAIKLTFIIGISLGIILGFIIKDSFQLIENIAVKKELIKQENYGK